MQDGTGAPERWLPIPGFEGYYEVSDQGRVRSLDRVISALTRTGKPGQRRVPGRTMVLSLSAEGYSQASLWRNNAGSTIRVHLLVLTAFVGSRPEGTEACHNNGDRADPRLVNLRWDTHSGNMFDRAAHGTDHERNKTHCPRQHLLAAPNLHADTARRGHRGCLACNRAKARVHYWKKQGVELDMRAVSDAYYAEIMAAAA